MKQKTSAEEYFEALGNNAGTLFYLKRKNGSNTEFVFESIIIDGKKKDLTVRVLKRAMKDPDFIAFPGTPEFFEFVNEAVDNPEKK